MSPAVGEAEDRLSGIQLRTMAGARPAVAVPRLQREQTKFVLKSALADGPVTGEASVCFHGTDESFQIIETSAGGFRQVLYVSGGGC